MPPAILYQLLMAIGAALGGGLFAYLTTRRFLMRAVMEEAATYRRLAEAKTIELGEVSKRLDYLEQLVQSLETQNAELRDLNVHFQQENIEQKAENSRLQDQVEQNLRRVEQLEAASTSPSRGVPPREL